MISSMADRSPRSDQFAAKMAEGVVSFRAGCCRWMVCKGPPIIVYGGAQCAGPLGYSGQYHMSDEGDILTDSLSLTLRRVTILNEDGLRWTSISLDSNKAWEVLAHSKKYGVH